MDTGDDMKVGHDFTKRMVSEVYLEGADKTLFLNAIPLHSIYILAHSEKQRDSCMKHECLKCEMMWRLCEEEREASEQTLCLRQGKRRCRANGELCAPRNGIQKHTFCITLEV